MLAKFQPNHASCSVVAIPAKNNPKPQTATTALKRNKRRWSNVFPKNNTIKDSTMQEIPTDMPDIENKFITCFFL